MKIQDHDGKKESNINQNPHSSASVDKIYYVHRNILAIGERRSGYFANLLHYRIDDGNRCSTIELSSRAADCFPDLLDYMYSSRAFEITTQNAMALLFLSQSFQVTALECKVKSFIEKDIKLNNFGYYMSDALHFSDEGIAVKIISTCEQEALSLMKGVASNVDVGLGKLLKAPLLSSITRAETFCSGIWSFLTWEKPPIEIQKKAIQKLLSQKYPTTSK